MGKHKQAQRTKNNARPSNSSRSAELLDSAMPNFVGFSAVKDGGYVPVLPGLSLSSVDKVEMSNVDTNFQIVLKKMNKKDATTKYKALQEFAILCQDSDLEAVEGMLPFWPRLYSALAIDIEHKVREATQLAHAAVVKRIGKGIAMYLKQLAGPWFTSQYDTYAPAASAATNSFNDTFPQNKIIFAIIHCQREILSYISDNIVTQTAQSLSAQTTLTPDEVETKYQKVLYSNLQGYSSYFKKVPAHEVEKTLEIHHKITSSTRFWKLAKHEALPVKTSFFNVLTSMIENSDLVMQDQKKKAVTAIMNSLNETEPALLSAVWESMLVAVNKIEDWYLVVNVEKLVLPKLWSVLRNGGQYCASIIYPNLLPFISQFPKLNVNQGNLYTNFFENIRQGFSVKSVHLNRSEMNAITVSFIECLRYSILQNIHDTNLCNELLQQQLIPVIEKCITENSPMKENFFCEVAQLLRYWRRNQCKEEYKFYSELLQQFWTDLKALFNKFINNTNEVDSSRIAIINNCQIDFLLTLKNAPVYKRKNLKVQFPDSTENIKESPKSIIKCTDVNNDTEFLSDLSNFVNTLCVIYFNKIHINHCNEYIEHLSKLVTHFKNRVLFVTLMKEYRLDADFYEFYSEVLKNWLVKDSMKTGPVVEIIFNFIKYIDNSDKDKVLRSLLDFDDVSLLKIIIYCGLSESNRSDISIRNWYSQLKITNILIDVAKEIVLNNCKNLDVNENLILLAFEVDDNKNLLISEEGINEIAAVLCNSINQTHENSITHIVQLILNLLSLAWTHKTVSSGTMQMLETLFKLCIQEDWNSDDKVSVDNIRTVWREGILQSIQKLTRSQFIDLTKKLGSIIWQRIYNLTEIRDEDVLIDITTDFVEIILENSTNMKTDIIKEIILTLLMKLNIQEEITQVKEVVLYGEVITGNLYVTSPCLHPSSQNIVSTDLNDNTSVDHMNCCLTWALFNTSLLDKIYLRSEENGIFHKYQSDEIKYDLILPGITDILINVLYVATLGNIYSNHYKSTKYYNRMDKVLVSLKTNIRNLTSLKEYNEILRQFQIKYTDYGTMAPYIVQFYCTELYPNENCKEYLIHSYNDASIDANNHNDEKYLQEIQVLSKYRKMENISLSMDDKINALIVARSIYIREDTSTCINVLKNIISYQRNDPTVLLLDCDISQASWEKIILPLEVIRFATELIKTVPTKLDSEDWDFILISLTLWQLSINKCRHNCTDFKVTALIVAISQLYHTLQSLLGTHEITPTEEISPVLLDEWKNVFVNDVSTGILQSWMLYADLYNRPTTHLKPVIVLDYLGKAISVMDTNTLFITQPDKLPVVSIDLNETVALSLKLLQSPIPTIQLGAYYTLKLVISKFVERDTLLVESEKFDSSFLNIRRLEEILINTQNIVNTILAEFKLCDSVSCTIQPFTDSYTYTLAYFLVWKIVLDMCAGANGDLRYQYAEILKGDYFPCLLNNIFRLMPAEVYHDSKKKGMKRGFFSTSPSLNFGESWTESKLDHIACWTYTNSLRYLPVLVRQWWSTVDSRVSTAVDKTTTNYISPMLCQEELLNNKLTNLDNMQVKVHPTAREVVALYQMDDTKLELSIVLPPNHPLGPITVEADKHAGAATNWKYCHMQLSIFLVHQNGSVWDGLLMWKKTLDKKFAGVEECYICFSIFHISTYQLPKLSCHTCRKKFHTPCLYKWFNTSQKSTCPICRNVF